MIPPNKLLGVSLGLAALFGFACKPKDEEASVRPHSRPIEQNSRVDAPPSSSTRKGHGSIDVRYTSDILENLKTDPEYLGRRLAEMGGGSDRAKIVNEVVGEAANADPPLSFEQIRDIMLCIDRSGFPEDGLVLVHGKLREIIDKMDRASALKLLWDFSSAPVRSEWGAAIGASMAKQDEDFTGAQLKELNGLGERTRLHILISYAQALRFSSASQMTSLLAGLSVNEEERRQMAEAAANSSNHLPPLNVIKEGLKNSENFMGPIFFKEGFSQWYGRDSKAASQYLIDHKDSIPAEFYRDCVNQMIEKLMKTEDSASADAWKKELSTSQ